MLESETVFRDCFESCAFSILKSECCFSVCLSLVIYTDTTFDFDVVLAHHCRFCFERNHEFCVAFYADVIDEYHTLVFVFIDETDVDFLACIFSELECEVFPFAGEILAAA